MLECDLRDNGDEDFENEAQEISRSEKWGQITIAYPSPYSEADHMVSR